MLNDNVKYTNTNAKIEIPKPKFVKKYYFLWNLSFDNCNFQSNVYICTPIFADMVKLVDMPDLGSGAARRVGSSPIIRTFKQKIRLKFNRIFLFKLTINLFFN